MSLPDVDPLSGVPKFPFTFDPNPTLNLNPFIATSTSTTSLNTINSVLTPTPIKIPTTTQSSATLTPTLSVLNAQKSDKSIDTITLTARVLGIMIASVIISGGIILLMRRKFSKNRKSHPHLPQHSNNTTTRNKLVFTKATYHYYQPKNVKNTNNDTSSQSEPSPSNITL